MNILLTLIFFLFYKLKFIRPYIGSIALILAVIPIFRVVNLNFVSFLFSLLSILLTILCIYFVIDDEESDIFFYGSLLLFIEGSVIEAFCTKNLFIFYLSFESAVISMYFLMGKGS